MDVDFSRSVLWLVVGTAGIVAPAASIFLVRSRRDEKRRSSLLRRQSLCNSLRRRLWVILSTENPESHSEARALITDAEAKLCALRTHFAESLDQAEVVLVDIEKSLTSAQRLIVFQMHSPK
jgi:hypothetical protein